MVWEGKWYKNMEEGKKINSLTLNDVWYFFSFTLLSNFVAVVFEFRFRFMWYTLWIQIFNDNGGDDHDDDEAKKKN